MEAPPPSTQDTEKEDLGTTGHLRGSVEITVFRGDKVLAVNSRRFGGFCGVGGKLEPGESYTQAARRELMEETGCEALSLKLIAGNTLDPIKGDGPGQWYCAGFIVDIGAQEPRSNEAGTTPFWTTKEELIRNSLFPEWYAWWFGLLEKLGNETPAASTQNTVKGQKSSLDEALQAMQEAYDELSPEERLMPITPIKTMNQLRVVALAYAVQLIAVADHFGASSVSDGGSSSSSGVSTPKSSCSVSASAEKKDKLP